MAKKVKLWAKAIWLKKGIYFQLLAHTWDQATNIGVILEFYYGWRNQEEDMLAGTDTCYEEYGIKFEYYFYASLLAFMLYRCVSAFVTGRNTSWKQGVSQFFDIEMLHAVYLTHTSKSKSMDRIDGSCV